MENEILAGTSRRAFAVDGFKHVSYLWNEQKAAELAGDEVSLLIYRSNLLGADLRLTNYGGGNTSCKAMAKDPLTGEEKEIMWVKGIRWRFGHIEKKRSCCTICRPVA